MEIDLGEGFGARYGLFTRRHAGERGFSPGQIRRRIVRGEWRVVLGSVLGPAGLSITPAVRDAAVQLAVPQSILSGPSALRLRGMDPLSDDTCITVGPDHHVRLSGIRVLRDQLASSDIQSLVGVITTSRSRAVLDCLRLLPDDDAIRLLDLALLRGWIELPELVGLVRAHTGRKGAKRLAGMVRRVAGGARSEAERVLVGLLRRASITGWRSNVDVWSGGRLIAVVDVAFEARRVAIEVDGWAYHHATDRFQRDRSRQNDLVAAGWTVLRFTWADLTRRPGHVLATIQRMIANSGPNVTSGIDLRTGTGDLAL